MTQGQHWAEALHGRIAHAIRTARQGRMSAQQLADETERLGYGISRSQIANYESGRKQSLDVAELLVIAAALKVPPVTLLFGGPPDADVEILPGWIKPTYFGIAWFSGDRDLAWFGTEVANPDEARDQVNKVIADPDSAAAETLRLMRERAARHRDLVASRRVSKVRAKSWDDEEFNRALRHDAELIEKVHEITYAINDVAGASLPVTVTMTAEAEVTPKTEKETK